MVVDTGEWGTFAWSALLLGAPAHRIAGGTDEIQRNIIAERVLGLPREPRPTPTKDSALMLTGAAVPRVPARRPRRLYVNGHAVPTSRRAAAQASAVDWAAEDYDRYYHPAPDASGPYFFIPSSVEELRDQEIAAAHWDVPDDLDVERAADDADRGAAGCAPSYPSTPSGPRRTSRRAKQARHPLRHQTITDAKGDRSLSPMKQDDPDLYLRIVERRPDGVVIRGAKLHISSAAVAHELIVMPTKRMKPGEEDWSIAVRRPGQRARRQDHQRDVRAAPRHRPRLLPVQHRGTS